MDLSLTLFAHLPDGSIASVDEKKGKERDREREKEKKRLSHGYPSLNSRLFVLVSRRQKEKVLFLFSLSL